MTIKVKTDVTTSIATIAAAITARTDWNGIARNSGLYVAADDSS